jgi:hypothetical protein
MPPTPEERPQPPDKESLAEDKPFSVLTEFTTKYLNPAKAKFVFLRKKGKRPYEIKWTTTANYALDDPKLREHVEEGKNAGYLIGSEDIRLIDADVIDHLEALGVLTGLKELAAKTLCTSSGNPRGSFHIWIDCPGIEGGSKRYDPINPVFNEEGKEVPVLEILGTGNQVVCPGSTHPSGTVYRVTNDLPILKVSKEEVFRLLEGLSQHKTGEREADQKKKAKKGSKKDKGGNGNNKPDEDVVFTTFARLSDGRMLEQIGSLGKYQFAIWDGKEITTVPEVVHSGLTYRPLVNDPIIKGFIVFPATVEEYISTAKLIEEIETFLKTYMDVSDTFLMIAARYVAMTYVYDRLESLCYLRVLSDFGSGKSRILSTIGHLCYKPILTTGSTTAAAITRILNLVNGTLVIDEADIYESSESNQLVKVFNTGHSKRCGILKCNTKDPSLVESVPSYCPKILATRQRWKDVALESRCITEMCEQSEREDLTINLPDSFYIAAEHIRNKLLTWRFNNYDKVTGMEADSIKLDHVDPRIKQSWSCLAYVVTQSEEDLAKFKKAMLLSEADMVEQNARRWEGQILKVYKDMYDHGERHITPTDLATKIAEEFNYQAVKPESVGKALSALKVDRKKMTQGMVIVHDEKRMNKLYCRYIPGYKLHLATVQQDLKDLKQDNRSAMKQSMQGM